MDRRTFVQFSSSLSVFGLFQHPVLAGNENMGLKEGISTPLPELRAQGYFNEDFIDPANEDAWRKVQVLFPRPGNFCQLENGYFSHSYTALTRQHQDKESYIQNSTSVFMRREQEAVIEKSRQALAFFFGWKAENLALTRNTTESLNTVISGFPWKAGDEVVIGDQDYGSMTEAFEQAAQRLGIVLKVAKVPVYPEKPEDVVVAYMQQMTSKTRMIHLTHLINLSGQIIPLKEVIRESRTKFPDACIVVDAAHSVAHIDYDWQACGADIIAGSLHKWMCNPIGLGFLYMTEEWIPRIWPLMGDRSQASTNIRRFEHQGTRPIQTIETIQLAVEFNTLIGGVKNKEGRLRYLQQSWTKELREKKDFQLWTPAQMENSCAIATVSKKGMTPSELSNFLWDKHQIFTVAINHPVIKGVRITPHLSNDIGDIEKLKKALGDL